MRSTTTMLLVITLTRGVTEADEAYVIGKRGQYTPVGAYLAGDEIVKIAVEHGAQLIHPGSSGFSIQSSSYTDSTRIWFLV